jgi:hypothetical protein
LEESEECGVSMSLPGTETYVANVEKHHDKINSAEKGAVFCLYPLTDVMLNR